MPLSSRILMMEGIEVDFSYEPRLFLCSDADGKFKVSELHNFTQEDLCSDDVMMLDVRNELYLWIGKGCRLQEKKMSLKVAREYIDKAPDGRSKECPIIEVPEGNEPWIFTRHFFGWKKQDGFVDPFQKNLKKYQDMGLIGRVVDTESE